MSLDFSSELQQFLRAHIKSVADLEALLLIRGEPDRQWSAAEVSQRLYSSTDMVAVQLRSLADAGLLSMTEDHAVETFRYSPSSHVVRAQLDALDNLYRERRVSVITAIYADPSANANTFANAFRLRKDK